MQIIETIPFGEIPGQTKLFLEYLDWSAGVQEFYQLKPEWETLEKEAAGRLSLHTRSPRSVLAEILRKQNADFGSDTSPTRDLERPDSVAIVTGQQVGIFGGPLYTIYKACTAIRMAEKLRMRGMRAVPIFWMDADDHDMPEVTRSVFIDKDSALRIEDYRHLLFEGSDESPHPVGSVVFPESIRQVVAGLLERLPDSIHKPLIHGLLDSTYAPGANFAYAFACLLARLFSGRGLLIFNPRDHTAKQLAKEVFRKALIDCDQITSELMQRRRELDSAGYHAQVTVLEDSTLLFLEVDGKRRSLVRVGDEFSLKNTEITFTRAELLSLLETEPWKFSPNVLLRPIFQDHLFPTAAYVGGPSEIAYFAQLEPLYRHLGIPMPVIWPRAGFTLLPEEMRSMLDRNDLRIEDCFLGKQHTLAKLVEHTAGSGAGTIVSDLGKLLDRRLESVRPAFIDVDATLGPALDNARKKILHQIQSLHNRLVQAETRSNHQLEKEVEILMNSCYPDGSLQEREMGIVPFLTRYGQTLVDEILLATNPETFAHQLAAV